MEAAVYLYGRGECDAAVERLNTRQLLVRQFTRALDKWIADGGPSDAARRRRVAAAFAIDAGWHVTRHPLNITSTNRDPWGRVVPSDIEKWTLVSSSAQPIVALWAVEQLPAATSTDAVDRTIAFAAVGFADGHAWNGSSRRSFRASARCLVTTRACASPTCCRAPTANWDRFALTRRRRASARSATTSN